eukprot:jgi/Galph1/2246/GphlegSOOS_G926.1
MLYFDLEWLESSYLKFCWPIFSFWFPALAWFRCQDYCKAATTPKELAQYVRSLVSENLKTAVKGPVRLLTHLRYFGVGFNPVSFFYVFDASGQELVAIVALISNIPWLESCPHILIPKHSLPTSHRDIVSMERQEKIFHVSPFLPIQNIVYHWSFLLPKEEKLFVRIRVEEERQSCNSLLLLYASLHLHWYPFSLLHLAYFLILYPWMTCKIILAIHWEAYRLWKMKQFPFYTHPNETQNSKANQWYQNRIQFSLHISFLSLD